MSKNEIKGFVLYNDWKPLVDFLDDQSAGVLLKALYSYAVDGKVAGADELTPECAGLYYFIIEVIGRDFQKWEESKERRIHAAQIGGQASATKRKQSSTNVNESLPTVEQSNEIVNDDERMPTNININKNINENINISTNVDINNSSTKTHSRFVPPTLDEIRSYITEKNYSVDAESFYNFYESKGWYVGKNKMTKWKAAIANWQRKEQKTVDPIMDAIMNFGGDDIG